MPNLNYYSAKKAKVFNITDDVQQSMANMADMIAEIVAREYARIYGKLSDVDLRTKVTMLSGDMAAIEEMIINNILNDSTYRKTIEQYIGSFKSIADINNKLHLDINKINAKDIIKYTTQAQQDKINAVVNGLIGRDELVTRLVQPVKNIISSNIMAGTTITDATKYLKDYIAGNDDISGKWESYAGQIARDTINQYDGEINNVIRQEYEMDKIQYLGSIIKDSREQCRRWVQDKGGILMYDELEDEIEWAYNNGSGMIDGTTPDNFLINRGGYNCRHEAVPIL